ncbi:hypothetical protein BB559_004940 [Furculomyces boomerangus]|uniref:Uncharacterized protein n=2 Tax=Harpellales TaxID=61421 RepID=A0A2T9YBT2_9FUNG|nr:hypothetical protein BB559_006526 [Furculomyces boomerangus]PVU89798.1 hypothetical protein BB559_004940 [Furculomyces boomerangus]PVZ96952.1 hypothetical protein BB558_007115 [Smittium angustum]
MRMKLEKKLWETIHLRKNGFYSLGAHKKLFLRIKSRGGFGSKFYTTGGNINTGNKVGVFKAIWRPIANIFLWSSLAYFGLKLLHTELHYKKLEDEYNEKIQALEGVLEEEKTKKN